MTDPIKASEFYTQQFSSAETCRDAAEQWARLAIAAESEGDNDDASHCERQASALRALARRKEAVKDRSLKLAGQEPVTAHQGADQA